MDNSTGPAGSGSEPHKLFIRRLDDLPEAKAYLDRIGARATSPWSAAIHTESEGYEFDKSSVKLEYELHGRTTTITRVRYYGEDLELAPTDAEQEAILEGAKRVRWPYAFLRYGLGHDLPEDMAEALRTGNIYIFYDAEKDPRTCYVQTYHPGVAGRGKYRSWVHIDTQEWISGQPPKLPLYGLDQIQKHDQIKRVFIHEGPKAAEMVKRYLDPEREDNRLDHKWAEYLNTGIHIGWPGGGNRYRRVDWSPLQHLKIKNAEVVVIADNDAIGVSAANAIAAGYVSEKHNPVVLEWPAYFPRAYDLADPWPEGAPALQDLLHLPQYLGDAAKVNTEEKTREVSRRLGDRSLAFLYGGVASVVWPEEIGLSLRQAKPETLRFAVERVSEWQKWSATDEAMVPTTVPEWILTQIVESPVSGLYPLRGMINHPAIYNGGLLSGKQGYVKDLQLYLDCDQIEPYQWETPQDAYRFLTQDWLGRFPLASPGDAARALLLPLTLLLRRTEVTGGGPLFFVTAPQANTGKSHLVRTLCYAVLGRVPDPSSYSKTNEEFGKRLFSELRSSPSVVFYDNLPNGWHMNNAELDVYATSDSYSSRTLGESRIATLPALTTMIFTGNNTIIEGDTVTRSVKIRLQREGEKDLEINKAIPWTRDNRSKILHALLEISRQPGVILDDCRFSDWGRMVAGPVAAIADTINVMGDSFGDGGTDRPISERLLDSMRETAEESGDNEALYEFFVALGNLCLRMEEGKATSNDMRGDDTCSSALRHLMRLKSGDDLNPNSVNPVLRRYEDNRVGTMVLRMARVLDSKKGRKRTLYWIDGTVPEPEM